MSSPLQQEKEKKEWLGRKHQTLYIKVINKQRKEHSKDHHRESNPGNSCQSFLRLDVTSSVTFLSLLLNTCSKGTEREASLNPLCTVRSSVTIQLLPFYRWFRRGLGIKWNCTRRTLVPAVGQNLELLSSSSLLLLADALSSLRKLHFFFAKHHTFYKYMHTETKKQQDQIILSSNCCQECR